VLCQTLYYHRSNGDVGTISSSCYLIVSIREVGHCNEGFFVVALTLLFAAAQAFSTGRVKGRPSGESLVAVTSPNDI